MFKTKGTMKQMIKIPWFQTPVFLRISCLECFKSCFTNETYICEELENCMLCTAHWKVLGFLGFNYNCCP